MWVDVVNYFFNQDGMWFKAVNFFLTRLINGLKRSFLFFFKPGWYMV